MSSSPDSPSTTSPKQPNITFSKRDLSTSATTFSSIINSHNKQLGKLGTAHPTKCYTAQFMVTCLNPQFRVKMAQHYFIPIEQENNDDAYDKLSLEQRRFARRVFNEELIVEEALTDEAAEMVDEVALGDTIQMVFQVKETKEYTGQSDLAQCEFPSVINLVDLKIIKRFSTLKLAYNTIFDPLSYLLVILGFSLFVMLSGWYHMGFVWRWGFGGVLISAGLFYWLWVQWKEFMDSYRCLKKDVRVHPKSKFFDTKKEQ